MKVLEEMNCKLKFAGWGGTTEREGNVGVEPRTGILYRGRCLFWVLENFRSVRNGMECPFQEFLSPNPLLFKLSLSWGCQIALCWPGLMERTCRSSQQNCYPSFCSCSVLTESKQEQGLQIPDLLLYVFTFFLDWEASYQRVMKALGMVGIFVPLRRCSLSLPSFNVLSKMEIIAFIA